MLKEWDITKKGEVFAYGVLWAPIRPHSGRDTIMPRPRYDIEMTCYRFLRGLPVPAGFTRPSGIRSVKHHYMAISNELWGVSDSIWPFEWNPNAERILDNKLENSFLMIGGHKSSSKTETIVNWGLVNYLACPFYTKCLITSVSLKAAKTKIWGSVSLAWQQAGRRMAQLYGWPPADAEKLLPGKLMANGIIRYEQGGVTAEQAGLELVAGDADGASQNTPKIQGTKRKYIYVILDELSELDHGLMNTIISNLFKANEEVGGKTDVTGAFNPNSHFDPAGKECEPYWSEEKKGWSHVDTTMDEWPIRRGKFIRFDGAKSPNVLLGYEKWNGLLTKATYDSFVQLTGTKSKEYWQMYAAFWSPTGSVECIYDENELARSMNPVTTEWIYPATPCAFMDPSFAHGGDGAAMAFGLCGEAKIEGKTIKVLSITEVLGLDAQIDAKQDKPTQVARLFVSECQKRGIGPQNAGMDTTGAGAVLYSLIAKDWSPAILKVGFGDSASDMPISRIDKTPAKEKYVRMVSEIWYSGKPLIRSGQIRGLPADVAIEMCARTYETVNGKIKVESKEDMKLRALRSPDKADAALGLAHLCRMRLGLMAEERSAGTLTGRAYRKGSVAGKVARKLSSCSQKGLDYRGGSALWKR